MSGSGWRVRSERFLMVVTFVNPQNVEEIMRKTWSWGQTLGREKMNVCFVLAGMESEVHWWFKL